MIEQIRKIDPDVPIIFAIASEKIQIIIKALQLNVTDFLKKPIDATQLVNRLIEITKVIYAEMKLKEEEERKLKLL